MAANLTLRDVMANLKADLQNHPYSPRLADLQRGLEELAEEYGWEAAGAWKVVRTRFHGGGRISTHRSALAALKAARTQHIGDCACGCCGVVPADCELPGTETNDSNGYSPYALTE